jgi:hypothetical protein
VQHNGSVSTKFSASLEFSRCITLAKFRVSHSLLLYLINKCLMLITIPIRAEKWHNDDRELIVFYRDLPP